MEREGFPNIHRDIDVGIVGLIVGLFKVEERLGRIVQQVRYALQAATS